MQRDELWREIPGFTHYEVSSLGRVRRVKRFENRKDVWTLPRAHRATLDSSGYPQVALVESETERHRTVKVHLLVALTFIGPRPTPESQCNHKDGDKMNASAENLEWTTVSENVQHAYDTGLHPRMPSDRHPSAKLTYEIADTIRRRYASGETQTSLAREFGVSQMVIYRVVNGKAWGHHTPSSVYIL